MNYHFKNNNIYYGNVLVAEDMRDATKQLNELEEMFAEELDKIREHHIPVWKIHMALRKPARLVDRNSDEFKLIMCIASELGVDADVDVFCIDHNAKDVSQLIEREDYDRIVDLLNELSAENEELKHHIEFLKKRCNEYWEEAGLNNDYYD